jgi:hypothetical protein
MYGANLEEYVDAARMIFFHCCSPLTPCFERHFSPIYSLRFILVFKKDTVARKEGKSQGDWDVEGIRKKHRGKERRS